MQAKPWKPCVIRLPGLRMRWISGHWHDCGFKAQPKSPLSGLLLFLSFPSFAYTFCSSSSAWPSTLCRYRLAFNDDFRPASATSCTVEITSVSYHSFMPASIVHTMALYSCIASTDAEGTAALSEPSSPNTAQLLGTSIMQYIPSKHQYSEV